MSAATFTLSAFGDEIADDLQEQLQVLRELSVGYLELRGVWGKNVLHLDDDEVGHSSGWHPALTCGRMGAALAISSQSAPSHRARAVDIVDSEQPTLCW